MMLEYLGEKPAVERLMRAVERVTAAPNLHIPDLGGKATPEQVTDAVCEALRQANNQSEIVPGAPRCRGRPLPPGRERAASETAMSADPRQLLRAMFDAVVAFLPPAARGTGRGDRSREGFRRHVAGHGGTVARSPRRGRRDALRTLSP